MNTKKELQPIFTNGGFTWRIYAALGDKSKQND